MLRLIYERWARGDFWTPEAFDQDVEVVWAAEVLDIGAARGLAGLESSIRRWLGAWDEVRMEAEQFIALPAGQVLVLVVVYGRGKGSGVLVESHEYAHLWTMRDGKATRVIGYTDRNAAREAAGLDR